MCSTSACVSFFSSVISYFNWLSCIFLFYFKKKSPEVQFPRCVWLDGARDKLLIDVSSARGLYERRWGAFLSSRTDGERARTNSPTLLSPPPHTPCALPPSVAPALSILHSSIYPSIYPHAFWIPASTQIDRLPLWISPSSLRAIPSVVPLEAVLTVMMPGWAPRGSPRLTSETQPDRQLERIPVQLSALARGSAEWIYSGRRKVCHREAPRVDS